MFRHIPAIIRYSSESMAVVLYKTDVVMSRWLDLKTFQTFELVDGALTSVHNSKI